MDVVNELKSNTSSDSNGFSMKMIEKVIRFNLCAFSLDFQYIFQLRNFPWRNENSKGHTYVQNWQKKHLW